MKVGKGYEAAVRWLQAARTRVRELPPTGVRNAILRLTSCAVAATMIVGAAPTLAGAVASSKVPAKKSVYAQRMGHQTQAEREAAAARMKLQKALLELNRTTLSGGKTAAVSAAAATPVPQQGGVPDYFGDANWAFSPPLAKFVDRLPGLGPDNANELGQFIAVAHPDTVTYPGADYYEIELRQYTEQMHESLPPTTLRGYVQVNNGTDPNTNQNTVAPDPGPHQLGPFIMARKDRPVRIKFINKLPTGGDGDLFIPVDTTMMGAGMGPQGMDAMPMNYTQNRATLHLHGGITPWISDGTPHQWITPADEMTPYPTGVSVKNVPDMPDPGPGAMTFFYTNQQSARLMFYHDHSYGITRLNVYAGEAAGYAISDAAEDELVADGTLPADQIPLIIQDKTFVDATTVLQTDPTWNWGTGTPNAQGIRPPVTGDLWYPHVYSPAQNPADLSGMNAYGRWHFGPWFWPPTTGVKYPPIPNPYYDPVNAPWENETIPAAPNPSAPGEAFMDTPVVNGTAFPWVEVDPKSYRLRILNAADDRFWNLQMYVADDTTVRPSDNATGTEVKMVPAAPGNATFPDGWPTDGREGGAPDPTTAGPEWIQVGSEGGFLPKPAVIPQQPITWNMDPTTFNMGNVDLHSLLVAPAERADVVVDFSQYAGKTLILYNDAPAAFPARDPRLDYYTGSPDLSDTGGYWGTQVGYGPNTRTIMQIKVKDAAPAQPFDLAKLEAAFASTASKAGVFAKSQNPIIVPDAAYNSAYNKSFKADTFARIFDFKKTFKTLADTTVTVNFENKAIQDEMGEAFDLDYGRMSGKLGLELPGTNAVNQNFILYGYIDPATEKVKMEMEPMAPVQDDGTQIWKITHNGVDTHPIHFHLFDVQVLNRVGWDNAVRVPDDNELGWKDTVRVSPLEDTIVALRPILPKAPFGVPDSKRLLDPTMPEGSTMGFANIDPLTGQALLTPITNVVTNFGWEYVWHCHILSHEEMDMMRPMIAEAPRELADPSVLNATDNTTAIDLSWTDPTPADAPSTLGNPKNEIGYRIERALLDLGGNPGSWVTLGEVLANQTSYSDGTVIAGSGYAYRVVAFNEAGDTASNEVKVRNTVVPAPTAPTGLTATATGATTINLGWTAGTGSITGYNVYRATSLSAVQAETVPVAQVTAGTTFGDTGLTEKTTYYYKVTAYGPGGESGAPTAFATTFAAPPAAPTGVGVTSAWNAGASSVDATVTWTDASSNENGFAIERATGAGAFVEVGRVAAGVTSFADHGLAPSTLYRYRVRAFRTWGGDVFSAYAGPVSHTTAPTPPVAPSQLRVRQVVQRRVSLSWRDNATNESGFTLQRSADGAAWSTVASLPRNTTTYTDNAPLRKTQYYYRVQAVNVSGASAWSPIVPVATR